MLKRSAFKQQERPARVRPPLTRIENCRGVYARSSPAVVAVPKQPPERSESYRRWVATLPCMACGIEGYTQAAHPNQGRGLGQKASDLDCFPLCSTRPGHMGHHFEHDNLIDMTLDERRAMELLYIGKTRKLAREAGRPELTVLEDA